jgi:hypothetical protein
MGLRGSSEYAPTGPASAWTRAPSAGTLWVHADATCVRADTGPVRADVAIYPCRNFITDASVRPSHGRSNGDRPRPRPSVRPSVPGMFKQTSYGKNYCPDIYGYPPASTFIPWMRFYPRTGFNRPRTW